MRDIIQRHVQKAHSSFRQAPRVIGVLAVVFMLLLSSGAVVAQSQTVESDDFENGNVEGWDGENFGIEEVGVEGQYSLRSTDGISSQEANPEWVEGPTISLQDEFTVSGTSRIDQGDPDEPRRAGFGIVEPTGDGNVEGVVLLFSAEYGATFIANSNLEDPAGLDTINSDFDDTWVNWELYSSGNGTVRAKVWQYGTSEPAGYQITREMSPESGDFTVFAGLPEGGRVVDLDNVRVEGTALPDSEELRIETRDLFFPGATHEYTVYFDEYDASVEHNVSTNVTENATVTSENSTALTVNTENNTLSATSDANVSQVVNVTAEYNGYVTTKQVVVAEPTMENLEILPTGLWRTYALFSDNTIFALIIAGFGAVAAGRFAGAFAGLATAEMVIVIGWLAGYVGLGMAMVSLFMCLFIGLNLAANIDYTVSRARR